MSPLSWIIVSLKTMRFVGLVGNAFPFRKLPIVRSLGLKLGLRGGQN
jgi:hypothetical protein